MGLSKKQQAIAERMRRNVELCREFMNDWLLFNQILTAYPSPGVNKAELENKFLKIKSKLAREHQVLKDALQEDYKLDAATMNIVSGATSLESIYTQSEVAIKKMQGEWHRAFISINETLGVLEDKQRRAEAGEKVESLAAVGGGGSGLTPQAKKAIILVVILLAIIGVIAFVPPIREMYMGFFQE